MQPVFHMAVDAFTGRMGRIMAAQSAVRTAALGDFVFVVRELQIRAAAVNVKRLPEQFAAHGRTFDVPAGTAVAPRAFPIRLARFGGFPQHEVQRVALVGIHVHALAGAQVVQRFAGKLAVFGKFAHGVIHVAVGRGIGFAVGDQIFNHGNHLADVFGGFGLDVGAQHAQRVAVFVHGGDEARGEFADGFAVFVGAGDDFVVNIGDVAHIGERIAVLPQPAGNHVEHDQHARVAEVAVVIDGHAADVHADVFGIERDKFFFLACEGVVEGDGHVAVSMAVGG